MKEHNEAGRRRKRRGDEEVERLVDEFEASGSSSTASAEAGPGAEHTAATFACEAGWEVRVGVPDVAS
jgi:hypothetical protein